MKNNDETNKEDKKCIEIGYLLCSVSVSQQLDAMKERVECYYNQMKYI